MPFICNSITELQEWIISTDLATWEASEIISNELEDEKFFKVKNKLERKLQNDYPDDPKRTIQEINFRSSPM
jgi:hypothetical protein